MLGSPLRDLLSPRQMAAPLLAVLVIGGGAAAAAVRWLGVELWLAATAVLVALLIPAAAKWRDDARRYGMPAMVLSALIGLQMVRLAEHGAQWVQLHILRWTLFDATGLISGANPEWAQAVWSWGVLLALSYLFARGMRGPWAWALLAWAVLHAIEHTYLLAYYHQTVQELRALGMSGVPAERLPGILGRDGWLATSEATRGTAIGRLPGLTTAVRLDVHFWLALGGLALLLPAADAFMARWRTLAPHH
jgi:hypothetical protein